MVQIEPGNTTTIPQRRCAERDRGPICEFFQRTKAIRNGASCGIPLADIGPVD
jgi:hypothetical protein